MRKVKAMLKVAGLTIAGIGFGLSSLANSANSGSSEYVSNVDLSFPGYAAIIRVKNISNQKTVNAVNLKVQDSSINIEASGFVQCGDDKKISFSGSKIYFGPVNMFVNDINENAALYKSDFPVSYKERSNLVFGPKWITEGDEGSQVFNVPLNQIKNGHPAVRVDPLEEVNKKLQAHLQGGGTKTDFYRNDQEIVLQRPVSVAGWCRKYLSPGNTAGQAGFETQNFTIQVKYEGDPAISAVNVELGQLGSNPQYNNNQALLLNQATFQPNIPHYTGKCIPDQNPLIRVNFKGAGKGTVRFKIKVEGSEGNFVLPNAYLGSYNSENQLNNHFDFDFPLIEKMNHQQFKWWNTINKTYNHELTVQAQVKDQNSDSYGTWKDFGSATFKHRCTPQVVVDGANAKIGGYQNQGNANQPLSRGEIKKKPQRAPLTKAPQDTESPKRLRIPTTN